MSRPGTLSQAGGRLARCWFFSHSFMPLSSFETHSFFSSLGAWKGRSQEWGSLTMGTLYLHRKSRLVPAGLPGPVPVNSPLRCRFHKAYTGLEAAADSSMEGEAAVLEAWWAWCSRGELEPDKRHFEKQWMESGSEFWAGTCAEGTGGQNINKFEEMEETGNRPRPRNLLHLGNGGLRKMECEPTRWKMRK